MHALKLIMIYALEFFKSSHLAIEKHMQFPVKFSLQVFPVSIGSTGMSSHVC